MNRWQHSACEQARRWISLSLDGELSQLEQAGLDRHLGRCAACSAAAVEVTGIVQLLRSAPLVEYERELQPAEPRRERARAFVPRARPALLAAVVSVAAAIAAFIALLGSSGTTEPGRAALQFRSLGEEARFLHLQQLKIEPPATEVAITTPPRFAPLRLL